MVDTLPLIQAMFLTQAIGAEQAFWIHMHRTSTALMAIDTVDASVQTSDTDPQSRHDALMLDDALWNAHVIFTELGRTKSSLLASMRPLQVAARLATNMGSCKQVVFDEADVVTCALSGRTNEAHEKMWCIQCPLNPLATGGAEPGFIVCFVRVTLLTSLRAMLDGATRAEEEEDIVAPPPPAADDPMEVDGWEAPPPPVPEVCVRARACDTHLSHWTVYRLTCVRRNR